jgi:hypothetical protein
MGSHREIQETDEPPMQIKEPAPIKNVFKNTSCCQLLSSSTIFSYLLHMHLFSFHDSWDHFEPQIADVWRFAPILAPGPSRAATPRRRHCPIFDAQPIKRVSG